MSSQPKLGNPAAVGLAGFGLTTVMLQLFNLGLVGLPPVLALGLVFGGLAQLFAGFQEMKVGNNFGFCAFSGYGAFWIALVLLKANAAKGWFPVGHHDVTWFLAVFTLFTVPLWVGSAKVSKGLFTIFSLLLVGFVLLLLEHTVAPSLKTLASLELIACALSALYGMAHIVLADVFGRDVLPMGTPVC